MINKRKYIFVASVAVVMAVCFIIISGLYVSLNSKYAAAIRNIGTAPSTERKTTAAASPKPTENKRTNYDTDPENYLWEQLAASQMNDMNDKFNGSKLELEDKAICHVREKKKFVYITFDDGPSKNTPKVLAILKKNNVKATFFVVYNKNKDYYRQIVNEGHAIAIHSYTHDYSKIYTSESAFFDDLNRMSAYIKNAAGVDTKIVRLPGGSSNLISKKYCKGIMTKVCGDLDRDGYLYYDWNAQARDATLKKVTPQQLLENVKGYTYVSGKPKPFVILLLHNDGNKTATVDALQSIIDYYKSLGYNFRKITDLTPTIHQPIQN